MSVEVGKIVEGKISGITNFGAFIDLPDGKTGLVHISEVAEEYVKDIKTHLNQNQVVKVKVLSMGTNGKISLSIKKASENPAPTSYSNNRVERNDRKPVGSDVFSFEDRLTKFLKDSDERMLDVKRRNEAKRGSGRK
jgi:S1 RNA binding domain protein